MSSQSIQPGSSGPAQPSISSPLLRSDREFLQGLEAILSPYYAQGASTEEINAVTKRAEDFFLSQRGQQAGDSEQAGSNSAAVAVQKPPSSTATSSSSANSVPPAPDDAPYPVSFQQLAALIASGAPIPGIKDIPDKLAEGEPSASTVDVTKARKPWEKAAEKETASKVSLPLDNSAAVTSGQKVDHGGTEAASGAGAGGGTNSAGPHSAELEHVKEARAEEGSGQV